MTAQRRGVVAAYEEGGPLAHLESPYFSKKEGSRMFLRTKGEAR